MQLIYFYKSTPSTVNRYIFTKVLLQHIYLYKVPNCNMYMYTKVGKATDTYTKLPIYIKQIYLYQGTPSSLIRYIYTKITPSTDKYTKVLTE